MAFANTAYRVLGREFSENHAQQLIYFTVPEAMFMDLDYQTDSILNAFHAMLRCVEWNRPEKGNATLIMLNALTYFPRHLVVAAAAAPRSINHACMLLAVVELLNSVEGKTGVGPGQGAPHASRQRRPAWPARAVGPARSEQPVAQNCPRPGAAAVARPVGVLRQRAADSAPTRRSALGRFAG